jgi:two-component system response regulator DctR
MQIMIVDDEDVIRDALILLFKSRGIAARGFASGESFLAELDQPGFRFEQPTCLLLDVRMKTMSGLELFDALHLRGIPKSIPVIFLTGHGDVPMAVDALKKGAFDFFEKPFNDNKLVDRVLEAFEKSQAQTSVTAEQGKVQQLLNTLTEREREVMGLILAGKYNKVIADQLGISMRTVEVHRARIFDKMGVKSAVELAQLLKNLN